MIEKQRFFQVYDILSSVCIQLTFPWSKHDFQKQRLAFNDRNKYYAMLEQIRQPSVSNLFVFHLLY